MLWAPLVEVWGGGLGYYTTLGFLNTIKCLTSEILLLGQIFPWSGINNTNVDQKLGVWPFTYVIWTKRDNFDALKTECNTERHPFTSLFLHLLLCLRTKGPVCWVSLMKQRNFRILVYCFSMSVFVYYEQILRSNLLRIVQFFNFRKKKIIRIENVTHYLQKLASNHKVERWHLVYNHVIVLYQRIGSVLCVVNFLGRYKFRLSQYLFHVVKIKRALAIDAHYTVL